MCGKTGHLEKIGSTKPKIMKNRSEKNEFSEKVIGLVEESGIVLEVKLWEHVVT